MFVGRESPLFSVNPDQAAASDCSYCSAEAETAEEKPAEPLWQRTTADPVAFYTFVLACFTGALVIVSAVQIRFLIRADKTATKVANAALGALPRGSLFCRIETHNFLKWALGEMKGGLELALAVENHGSGPAIIEEAAYGIELAAEFPDWKNVARQEMLIDNVIPVDAPKYITLRGPIINDGEQFYSASKKVAGLIAENEARIYVWVKIRYRDIYRRDFVTSYCVSYKADDHIFTPEGGKAYNYQT